MFTSFVRRGLPKVTAVAYTLRGGFNKSLFGFLSNKDVFHDTYVLFYGVSRKRIYTSFRTIYLDTPFLRGYVFRYGAILAQTPITLYLNLDSKCFKRNLVEESIEGISEGLYSLYIAIPFTTKTLLTTYSEKVYRILKELGLGLKLFHPSYTFVVGKSRIFKDVLHTLWSSEILAAILVELIIGKDKLKVVDIGCSDNTLVLRQDIENLFMNRLVLDLITLLVNKKVIDERKAKEYIDMVISS